MDKENISSENIDRSQPANAEQPTGKESYILKPITIADTKLSDFIDWLKAISVFKLVVTLGEVAILLSLVSYLADIPNRKRQEIQLAREVLHEQAKNEYSDARITALKALNKHCKGNPGLQANKGKMRGLKLDICRKFSLQNWSLKLKKRGMDLSNSNLQGADLSGADLQGINLQGSNLQDANLSGANLEGANLIAAELQGADLSRANLKGATLKNSKLNGSILYGTNFEGADFSGAELKETRALWANFNHAKFNKAELESANFNRTQLIGADFYKANLKDSKLRFADLGSKTKKNEQLKIAANLREADLKGADLWGTKFSSTFQLKRAKNWEEDKLMPNWEQQIKQQRTPRLKIALLKPSDRKSIFNAYGLGMRRAANRHVKIWAINYSDAQDQAKKINELVEKGIDGIILTPEKSKESDQELKKASEAGVAITTVDSCFDRSKAEDLAIACYDTDKIQMGRDSGKELEKWARKHILPKPSSPKETIQVALVDQANKERYYPYVQGFLESIKKSDLNFEIKDSVGFDSDSNSDIEKVIKLLEDEDNKEVRILWGGSNEATRAAINAIKDLRKDNVQVFGILDLPMKGHNSLEDISEFLMDEDDNSLEGIPDWLMDEDDKLFNDKSPLKLIINQYRHQVGYKAVKRTINVLRGEVPGEKYEKFTIKHSLLTKPSDIDKARKKDLCTELPTVDKKQKGKKRSSKDYKPVCK